MMNTSGASCFAPLVYHLERTVARVKRVAACLLAAVMIVSLAACNSAQEQAPDGSSPLQADPPPADALAHEHLFYESGAMVTYAHMAEDSGVTLQAEYVYGSALAPVSALRFCVDNILWLKGEGETVADIVSAAPFGDWDAIVAAGLASPMPFYFEGLLYQVQGMDAEAAACYEKAEANPNYEEQDFYYLKDMSVEELYALRDRAVEKELAILDEYTPRATLYAGRTGAEFAPVYHAALAGEKLNEGDTAAAFGCWLNAVLAGPHIPDYYAAAVLSGVQAGQSDTALAVLNEGLWAFPNSGEINYAAATVEVAAGNMDSARAYLQTAQADAELSPEFAAECDRLLAQMGG